MNLGSSSRHYSNHSNLILLCVDFQVFMRSVSCLCAPFVSTMAVESSRSDPMSTNVMWYCVPMHGLHWSIWSLRESCCTQRSCILWSDPMSNECDVLSALLMPLLLSMDFTDPFVLFVNRAVLRDRYSDPMSNECDALSALLMPLLLSMDFTDPVHLFVNRAVLRDSYLVCSRLLSVWIKQIRSDE